MLGQTDQLILQQRQFNGMETSTLSWTTFTKQLWVQRNNVIIDGDNYSLQGNGSGTGFDVSGIKNVTIENTLITGWSYGIRL